MRKKFILLLAVALLTTSCDNNSNVKSLEDNTKPTKPDVSDTLLGYDLDNNGIREDVEYYISTLAITDKQKQAARFEAKVLQDVLVVDVENVRALQASNKDMLAAINCINSRFENYEDADAVGISLESKTFNTSKRRHAYNQYNKALVNSNFSMEVPTGDSCQVF